MEEIIIIGESVNVFSKPNTKDTDMRIVKKGEKFLSNKIEKINNDYWIKITIDKHFKGYINRNSEIAVVIPVKSNQKEIIVYKQPNVNSKQIRIIDKNEIFYLIHKTYEIENKKKFEVVKNESTFLIIQKKSIIDDKNKLWDKIELNNREIGYIESGNLMIPNNYYEGRRRKKCKNIAIIYAIVNFLIALIVTASVAKDKELPILFFYYACLGTLNGFIFYHIFLYISIFFKSKIEKYYSSRMLIYNNQIY